VRGKSSGSERNSFRSRVEIGKRIKFQWNFLDFKGEHSIPSLNFSLRLLPSSYFRLYRYFEGVYALCLINIKGKLLDYSEVGKDASSSFSAVRNQVRTALIKKKAGSSRLHM